MNRRRLRSASASSLIAALVALAGAIAARPGDTAPLARYFPREDLVLYIEFDGLDAHRAAWTKTAAYRLLNETTTGAMYEQSIARIIDIIRAKQSSLPVSGQELVVVAKHLLRAGFAVGINRAGGTGPPRCFGVVIRGAARGEVHAIVERLVRSSAPADARGELIQRPQGREVHVLPSSRERSLTYWSEGDDLVVSLVAHSGHEAIIAALEGREPNALDHPNRVALATSRDLPGFEPVGLAFFDMAALPALPKEAVVLGLDRIRRFDYRWGFHDRALESIVGVAVPSPRTGIPALFDQPTFSPRQLPPLPGVLASFTVISLDLARLWSQLVTAVDAREPRPARKDLGRAGLEQAVLHATGLHLREDLLVHLGSRFTFYNVPVKVNAPSHILEGLAQGFFRVPKLALVVDVKNREAVAKALEKLVDRARGGIRVGPTGPGGFSLGEIQRLKDEDVGFVSALVGSDMPIAAGVRPTLLLGRKTLVLASTPAMAKSARDLHEGSQAAGLPPGSPLAQPLESLPEELIMLSADDTAQSILPELVVGLPGLLEALARGWRFPGIPPLIRPFQTEELDETEVVLERQKSGEEVKSNPKPPAKLPAAEFELIPDPEALRPFLFPSVHALAVNDQGVRFISREAIPTLSPATAVPVAIALLLPATQAAHNQATRAQSVNNLKQIGLALHNFLAANNHFPADIRSKDGKPLLSWRVQLLPFLEQQELFNALRLDEPWDGPHNKAVLERMPAVFAVPTTPAEPGMTFYRGFSGRGALFDSTVPEGVGIQQITDGTSNTIAVVEASDSVPWTKPASDLPSEMQPKPEQLQALLAQLGGHFHGGFNALFCDGSVRFIKKSISVITFGALLTRDGGEVISVSSF
jgi:prepilin-type processing-associated H-X9-DG protein